MAPEAPNQKRKRGRPSTASKNNESASGRVTRAAAADDGDDSQSQPLATRKDTTDAMEDSIAPKKRGRPRKSTEAPPGEDAPSVNGTGVSESGAQENEGSSNSRKRGRPTKSPQTVSEVEDAPADNQKQKRRRQATEAQTDENEPPAKVRKTGKAAAAVAAKAPPAPAQSEATESSAKTTVRRSARDRRSADSNPYWSRNSGTASPETNRSNGEGRSSLREVSVAESQNRPSPEVTDKAKKKRGPGRRSLNSNAESSSSKRAGKISRKETSQEATATAAKKSKDAPRKSDEPSKTIATKEKVTKAGAKKKTPQDPTPEPASNRQRRSGGSRSSAGEGESEEQQSKDDNTKKTPPPTKPRPSSRAKPEVPKYRHLAPKTRQIPRSTIASKWTPLDDGSISVVDSIISDASRAVLHRLRDREKHREQAETVLNAFARRLHSKLVKGIPFPPPSRTVGSSAAASAGIHEAELDFDRVMGAIKAVEGTLDPLSHSVALLSREKEKEEAALEADYKRLRKLKSNMRDETKKWIEHAKREHKLVPKREKVELVGGEFDEKDLLGQVRCVTVNGLELVKRRPTGEGEKPGGVFKGIPSDDEELTALAQRIGRHMNSMKSNLAQIDGVLPAITQSKASLQGVLYQHLDPELYEEVLFGKKEKNGS